ncbi:response regulator [Edaphobacter acidisoli]|nr:response regulator [Edaphobacter acidisoli]
MLNSQNVYVYVVDDEKVIADTLVVLLRQSGFLAESFSNPLNALERASTEAPNLLISDVMMPQMSGIDLAIRLRALHPLCKVLLFSGQAATADLLQKAREEGYNFDLLLKPVHPTDLLAAIQRVAPHNGSRRTTLVNAKAS